MTKAAFLRLRSFGCSISRVDPLPLQVECVYDYLLKLARVRFLLAGVEWIRIGGRVSYRVRSAAVAEHQVLDRFFVRWPLSPRAAAGRGPIRITAREVCCR